MSHEEIFHLMLPKGFQVISNTEAILQGQQQILVTVLLPSAYTQNTYTLSQGFFRASADAGKPLSPEEKESAFAQFRVKIFNVAFSEMQLQSATALISMNPYATSSQSRMLGPDDIARMIADK